MIVATILPGSAAHPAKESSPLEKGPNGELSADGTIERAKGYRCLPFRLDRRRGRGRLSDERLHNARPGCKRLRRERKRSSATHRRNVQSRERAAVKMNLPAGTFYVAVTGSDEVGEVGYYHLDVKQATGDIPAPLPASPSFVVAGNAQLRSFHQAFMGRRACGEVVHR